MEFNLIDKYFTWKIDNPSIIKAVGDDCAIVDFSGKLITSTDTIVGGVHFFMDAAPENIAYKALAVNLSDIAAMGGIPLFFTLAITMPQIDENWLNEFSKGLKNIAKVYNLALIGGDTTRGNLSITINIFGKCDNPMMRSGAKIGDNVFVSGELGAAKLALEQMKQGKKPNKIALDRLQKPTPKIKLGQSLSGVASSCIDISDGLLQDLNHILKASNVGCDIVSLDIPIFANSTLEYALNGGDDYELCFVTKAEKITNCIKIGTITKKLGLRIDGKNAKIKSYQHF